MDSCSFLTVFSQVSNWNQGSSLVQLIYKIEEKLSNNAENTRLVKVRKRFPQKREFYAQFCTYLHRSCFRRDAQTLNPVLFPWGFLVHKDQRVWPDLKNQNEKKTDKMKGLLRVGRYQRMPALTVSVETGHVPLVHVRNLSRTIFTCFQCGAKRWRQPFLSFFLGCDHDFPIFK